MDLRGAKLRFRFLAMLVSFGNTGGRTFSPASSCLPTRPRLADFMIACCCQNTTAEYFMAFVRQSNSGRLSRLVVGLVPQLRNNLVSKSSISRQHFSLLSTIANRQMASEPGNVLARVIIDFGGRTRNSPLAWRLTAPGLFSTVRALLTHWWARPMTGGPGLQRSIRRSAL